MRRNLKIFITFLYWSVAGVQPKIIILYIEVIIETSIAVSGGREACFRVAIQILNDFALCFRFKNKESPKLNEYFFI